MQTNFIIQFFTLYIQKETAQLSKQLSETLDFRQFEDGINKLMNYYSSALFDKHPVKASTPLIPTVSPYTHLLLKLDNYP